MFKGFTEKLRTRLEEFNQNSDQFLFNVSDLEYSSDRQEWEYKFSIHSDELQQKLGQIIVLGGGTISNPKGIKFGKDYKLPLPLKEKGTKNHQTWIMVNKKFLAEQNRNNKSKVILFPTDSIGNKWRNGRIENDFEIFSLTYMLYHGLSPYFSADGFYFRGEAHSIEKAEIKEKETRNKAIFKASGDALKEINQTLSENNIDIENAEIDWMDILPDWCSCEVKEFGNAKNNNLHRHHINSCLWREESEIIAFKDKVIEAIKLGKERVDKLVASKNSSNNTSQTETNQTNSEETKETTNDEMNNDSDNNSTEEPKHTPNNTENLKEVKIQKLRESFEVDVKTALLSPAPILTNSDLGFEHQNWESKLEELSEEKEINSYKDRLLSHIQAQRKSKQTSQKVDENLHKAQDPNATVQDKKNALDELDKNEGEQAYEEKKEQVKETKKQVAKDNPSEYKSNVIANLNKKLAENGLKESDLDSQTQQEIKDWENGSELEPEKLVETEMKLTEKIGQAGAKKKISNLVSEVEKVLQKKDKNEIEKLKQQLLEIINSSIVYYSSHKSRAEQLLKQLENISELNNDLQTSDSWPLSVKIVIGVGIILIISLFVIWKIKKTNQKNTKSNIK